VLVKALNLGLDLYSPAVAVSNVRLNKYTRFTGKRRRDLPLRYETRQAPTFYAGLGMVKTYALCPFDSL